MVQKTTEILMREEHHDFQSLVEIMKLLRSENGCPWDKEQTHESIRSNFIEETYEVVEAIDNRDPALLQEELGDVLLQVVFHARMSEEAGEFNIEDVIHDICAKLIHRHPHIFGDVKADTSDAVLNNWEKIKAEEKQRIGLSGSLQAIPPSLPSLMKAQKTVKKAGKENMSPNTEMAEKHLKSACEKMSAASSCGDKESMAKSLRNVLLASSVIAQLNGLDAEELLYDACRDITRNVEKTEEQCGKDLFALSENERKDWAEKAFFLE